MTVDNWESFSNENILAAEKQRNNSQNLRSLIDGILQQVANDMEQQRKAVDVALQIRIDETRDSKCKLEDHLSKVQHQFFLVMVLITDHRDSSSLYLQSKNQMRGTTRNTKELNTITQTDRQTDRQTDTHTHTHTHTRARMLMYCS